MWFRCFIVFAIAVRAGVVAADDAVITVEVIQSRLEQVEKSTTLSVETKASIRTLYQQAAKDLASAAKARERAEQFSQMARTAPEDIGRIRRDLVLLPETPDSLLYEDESLDRLRVMLTESEAELAQLRNELQRLKDEPKKRAAQRRAIPLSRATTRKQLDDLQLEIAAVPPPDEPPELALARQANSLSRAAALQAKLDAGTEELDAYEKTIDLLPLQRDFAAAQVALVQAEVETLQKAVERRLSSEVYEHLRQAEAVVAEAVTFLKPLAKVNLRLVQQRKELRVQLEEVGLQLGKVERLGADLAQQRARTEEKVDAVGLTGPVGLLLRQQKSLLPDVSNYRRDLRQREPELRSAQLNVLELEHRRADLSDLEVALERAEGEFKAKGAAISAEAREQLRQILTDELRYTDYLLDDSKEYVDQLLKLAAAETSLLEATEEFTDYIDERVLWVRSAGWFSLQDLPLAAKAARSLIDGAQWKLVAAEVVQDVGTWFFAYLFALALLLLVFASGRLMSLRRNRPSAMAVRQTRLKRLLRDSVELFLYALPLPLLFWLAGLRLIALSDELPFMQALGTGLAALGRDLLPLMLLLRLCRPRGFVRRYLGWTDDGMRQIRAILVIVILAVLPLTFVRTILNAQDNVLWQDSLGRICFVLNVLLVAVLVERLLRPRRGVLYRTFASFKGDWLRRLRWVWYVAGVGSHIGLAVLALVGYTYAADLLGNQVRATALLAFCLLLVGSFLVRWSRLNTRRLAIANAGRAAAEQRAADRVAREFGMPPVVTDTGGGWLVDEKAGSKMQPLVSTVLVIIGLVGLWMIWSNVVPALNVVNQITIWHTEVPVAETVATDDASQTLHRPTQRVPITLGDVLLAGFILLATIFASRYLAGLFELPVLERLPLDKALENTITTVTKYALWIVAVIVAASFLGIGWSKVQWMVAALSLGLGFGLQEIFANFISGLIILFERPMRVGDIITVGDATGVVRAIRMRATTIMDWDRKELVVPNKEFATGRLLNWTLTNKTNRRVLRVGVEYGSDADQVRDLLLKVARESDRVMADPAPIALLEEFGENALIFSLRVYHSKISHRLRGLHELNAAIQREFKAAGIRVAFPQRDLHLRSSHPSISWFGPEEEKDPEEDDSQP